MHEKHVVLAIVVEVAEYANHEMRVEAQPKFTREIKSRANFYYSNESNHTE